MPIVFDVYVGARASGKTYRAARAVHEAAMATPGITIMVVHGGTDALDLAYGPSGVATVAPDGEAPVFVPNTKSLVWKNGSIAVFSAYDQASSRARGMNLGLIWFDEPIAEDEKPWALLSDLMISLRKHPGNVVVSTRPGPPLLHQGIAPYVFVPGVKVNVEWMYHVKGEPYDD